MNNGKNRGITLIALVVTIIVLLILAGISIMMLTGQNGILNRAGEAKELTGTTQTEEQIKLAIMYAQTQGLGNLSTENIKQGLDNYVGTGNYELTGNEEKGWTVTIGDKTYEVDQFGNITELSVIPKISYNVTNIDGTEITGTLPSSAKLNIKIDNITELIVTNIIIKDSSGTTLTGIGTDLTQGITSAEITENANYIVDIQAIDKKGKDASASLTVEVTGKLKIANIEDHWVEANSSNNANDWYVYRDNEENIVNVNPPKLAAGMTAIKYEADSGELVEGGKWANAMTKDGSMWVWIPRYAYKITSGYHQSGTDINEDNGALGAGTIEIAFVDKYNNFLNGETGEVKTSINDVTYTDGKQNEWLLEPAFTFGTEEITGFWFAKFEASPVGVTSASEANTNDTTKIIQIKPNKYSWRFVNVTPFNRALNLKNKKDSENELIYFNDVSNVDTHLTKNVEWGAVAYLAHSKYGLDGEEICLNTNDDFLTGYGIGDTTSTEGVGSPYNTTDGIKSSTTKNVYGIYDMSGGAWELVAACLTSGVSQLTSRTDEEFINKYIDVYEGYSKTKYGDAVYEVSSGAGYWWYDYYAWFSDHTSFVNGDYKLLCRGGGKGWSMGAAAGLFQFNNTGTGYSNYSHGFRPVCVVI